MHTTKTKFNFQKKTLDNLPVPKTGRLSFYDAQVRGLCIQIMPSGHRSFGWYRSVQARPRFLHIGAFPDLSVEQAREQAEENNAKLAKWKSKGFDGGDPFGPRRDGTTLSELLEDYCAVHLAGAKNVERARRDARWHIAKYLPSWRERRAGSIRRRHVLDLYSDLCRNVGIHTAARVTQLLCAIYNDAIDREMFEGENPAARIKRPAEPKRDRTLNPDELKRFFQAVLTETNIDLRDSLLIALFTGARKGDVLSMQWADLELKGKQPTWRVPFPKNRKAYTIGLVNEAADVLKRRAEKSKSEWVFPGKTEHVLDFKNSWKRFLKRASITDFRVHDLRHVHASAQANLGASLPIIGKSLGHTSVAATQIYSQVDAAPVRKSVNNAVRSLLSAGKVNRQKLLNAPRE